MTTYRPSDPDPPDAGQTIPGDLQVPAASFLNPADAAGDDTVDDQEHDQSAPPGEAHEVALWAGVAAFFGSLLAIGIFDVFEPDQWAEYLGALIVAAITAGGVYAKQRLDDAKHDAEPSRAGSRR